MTNYPAGAANDSRAPFNETEVKPVKVDVIVYEAATQFTGDVQNFVVHVVDSEPGTVWGCGCNLIIALNDFEMSYALRYNELCEAVVTRTIIQY